MKTSYFSISKSLIKENLRRFWVLSFIIFLAYFISGVLPILVTYDHIDSASHFIDMLLSNMYPVYSAINLLAPITTSIVVFRYLNNSSSTAMIRNTSVTRAKLFNNTVVSGLFFCLIPVILIAIILLCIAKPTIIFAGGPDVFTDAAILQVFFKHLLQVFCVYSIALLAGVIAGNSIIHFLTALWFNVLPTTLYLIFIGYSNLFLFGHVPEGADAAVNASPFFGIMLPDNPLGPFYFIVSLGLIILSSFLYQKRKTEQVKTSFVFPWAKIAVCLLLAFYGAITLGLLFYVFNETSVPVYLTMIIGGMICLIISTMIVKRTFKIFTKKLLRNIGIYMVVMILFIGTIFLNLTGFETKVPKLAEIQHAQVSFSDLFSYSSQLTYVHNPLKEFEFGNDATSVDNIERIRTFHKDLVKETSRAESSPDNHGIITFNYTIEDNSKVLREYRFSPETIREMKALKTFYESKEFKEFYSLEDITFSGDTYLVTGDSYEDISLNKSQRQQILRCMEKDFQASHYEDQFSGSVPYAALCIDDPALVNVHKGAFCMDIKPTDQNTIKWLAKHGYDKKLAAKFSETLPDIKEIAICPVPGEDVDYDLSDYETLPKNAVKVTEPKQIAKVLPELGLNEEEYICTIIFKGSTPNNRLVLYYEGDPLPSFLKGKF